MTLMFHVSPLLEYCRIHLILMVNIKIFQTEIPIFRTDFCFNYYASTVANFPSLTDHIL